MGRQSRQLGAPEISSKTFAPVSKRFIATDAAVIAGVWIAPCPGVEPFRPFPSFARD